MDLPYDSVWPGEESDEERWTETNGIDKDGQMWLTPRMERVAAHIQKEWDVWKKLDRELL